MSRYYVIGSDLPMPDIKELGLGFEAETNLQVIFSEEKFDKRFYYVSGSYVADIGYDIVGLENFSNDGNKIAFEKFLNCIRRHLSAGNIIEFYQLWTIYDDPHNECNVICAERYLSTDMTTYPEDKFHFEYNIRYIFR